MGGNLFGSKQVRLCDGSGLNLPCPALMFVVNPDGLGRSGRRHPQEVWMKYFFTLIWSILLLSTNVSAQAAKQAILFIDPSVTYYESYFQEPRIKSERDYYEWFGYEVTIQVATEENIVAAILDGKTRAISFFGHGNGPDSPGATSTLLQMRESDWQARVYMELRRRYAAEGMPADEAKERASDRVQNFGFDIMRNHSCSSLIDTRLAEVFVRGGGSYYGSPALYSACPTPTALFSDTSWLLEEYIVPFIATRDMPSGATTSNGPCAVNRGPAGGCVPGLDGCVPCPGDDIMQWYVPAAE